MNIRYFQLFLVTALILFHVDARAKDSRATDSSLAEHVESDLALLQAVDAFISAPGSSALYVGYDSGGCSYTTIQAAINAAKQQGITKILIARSKTYQENLQIHDMSISLIGGYATCLSARAPFSSPGDNQVIIDGGGVGSVIHITGAAQRHNILLKNLRVINGKGWDVRGDPDNTYGGGILAYGADALVSLKNVDVRGNTARTGGGIAVYEGDTDLLMQGSRVLSNDADNGGGIYCRGSESSVVVASESGVIANVAKQNGGGVYLGYKCFFALYSGTADSGLVGVSANIAFGNGGGIYASPLSVVSINSQKYCPPSLGCLSDGTNPASMRANIAGFNSEEGDGGAIYADEATIRISGGYFEGNSAVNGGAIYLYEYEYDRDAYQASLRIGHSGKTCWDNRHCNWFVGNSAIKTGGAIHSIHADIDISASVFEQNTAANGDVTFVDNYYFETDIDVPNSIRIEGSLFHHNGDSSSASTFYVRTNVHFDVIHSTIVDNEVYTGAGTKAIFMSQVWNGHRPTIKVSSSIIDNPGHDIFTHINSSDYPVDFTCLIVNEKTSLSSANQVSNIAEGRAGGDFILITDPGFVDRSNKNYHLARGSKAIDYCFTPTYAEVLYKDIDGQDRGDDDPDHPNNYLLSYYDIGADEAYYGELIFKNSFD